MPSDYSGPYRQKPQACMQRRGGLRQAFEDSEPAREIPPPIPAFSMTGGLSPLLLIPMAIPVMVALFAPRDVLDAWPWARQFTHWVQHIVPFVRMSGHADSTTYPQVALLVHSMTLTVIPLASLVWLWQTIVNYPQLLKRNLALGGLKITMHLGMLFVAPVIFIGGIWIFISLPGDPSFAKNWTTNNRVGFSVLTFLSVYLTSLVIGGQVLNLRLFWDTYLSSKA